MSNRYRMNGVRLTLEQCKDPSTNGVALAECLNATLDDISMEVIKFVDAICSNPNLNFDAITQDSFDSLEIIQSGEIFLGNAGWPLHFLMSVGVPKGLHRIWDRKAINRIVYLSTYKIHNERSHGRCEALAQMLTGRKLSHMTADSFKQGEGDRDLARWRASLYVFANACGAICMEECRVPSYAREDVEPNGPALAVCKAAGVSFWPPEFDKYLGYSQNRRRRR